MLYASWIVAVVFFAIAVFLGKEMMKKFGFISKFAQKSGLLLPWYWLGSARQNLSPGMYTVIITGPRPFAVLVGFELRVPLFGKGFDYYGYVESSHGNVAAFSTYLGRGFAEFQFLTTLGENDFAAATLDRKEEYAPTAVYPPHWWQKLGFYG